MPYTMSPHLPSSRTPGGSTPISYRANVNRQKTKKWTEAKTPDYGGDDWGDDEDEYFMPPPAASKPTGLRQQGQGLESPVGVGTDTSGDATGRKAYGELPSASTPRARNNSFTQDDEKRDFSSATIRQPSTPVNKPAPTSAMPATRFSQMGISATRSPSSLPPISTQHAPPSSSLPSKMRSTTSPIAESPQSEARQLQRINTPESGSAQSYPRRSNTGQSGSVYSQPHGGSPAESGSACSQPSQPARINTGGSSSLYTPLSPGAVSSTDAQDRQDHSPSSLPPPLANRGMPYSSTTEGPAARFPIRKSSLGQMSAPDPAELTRSPQGAEATRPWMAAPGRTPSPGAAARSSGTAKPLPFVRPSDIYRRVEEEREKERQSIDSGRPSMDAIQDAQMRDNSSSPAKSALRGKTSSESLGNNRGRAPSVGRDDASESGRNPLSPLEPVKERKSEYGFEGFELGKTNAGASPVMHDPPPAHFGLQQTRTSSASPKIPDLKRMSGFGEDMFSHTDTAEENPAISEEVQHITSPSDISAPSEDPALRNQPSLGFRTVVTQAFSRSDDPVPDTPSSREGSDFHRTGSTSTGTAGISPIMSRASSSAQPGSHDKEFSTPRIDEISEEVETPHVETPKSPTGSSTEKLIPRGLAAADDLSVSRPTAAREASFRPALPGGWVSYAPSTSSTTPQSEHPPTSDQLQSQTRTTTVQSAESIEDADRVNPNDVHLPAESSHAAAIEDPEAPSVANDQNAVDGLSDLQVSSRADEVTSNVFEGNPSGGSVSSTPTQSSILPALMRSSPEHKSRSDTGKADSSVGSNIISPLPKDSPQLHRADFDDPPKPTPPLKTKQRNSTNLDTRPEYMSEHQMSTMPGMNPNGSEEDNEKLQEDIVKSLTPRTSGVIGFDHNRLPGRADEPEQIRESAYFPSEYDSYWASTAEEDLPIVTAPSAAQVVMDSESQSQPPVADVTKFQTSDGDVDQYSQPSSRPQLRNRFSWERSTEKLKAFDAQDSMRGVSDAEAKDTLRATMDTNQMTPTTAADPILKAEDVTGSQRHSQLEEMVHHRRSSSYPVSATSPKQEHLATSSDIRASVEEDQSQYPTTRTLPMQDQSILNFKDITTMPLPYQRIQALRSARQSYAMMPSGLEDWMVALKFGADEHRDVTTSFGGPGSVVTALTGSSRNKFAKAIGGGGGVQQPYYQQYLNASSPSATQSSRPGPATPAGTQHGFSQGTKLSTQQVQAKGKELLHTAGIFGGKAGKAGKGLLAKGKSRLRGAGGEKVD